MHPGKASRGHRAWARIAACLAAFVLCSAAAAPHSDLQRVAARVQDAANALKHGTPVPSAVISTLKTQLEASHRNFDASERHELEAKYRSVVLLLSQTELGVTRSETLPGAVAYVSREVLTPMHGTTCKSALGLSERTAVELTLDGTDGRYSDVWLHFEPLHDGTYLVATGSTGPDPAIEILIGSCGNAQAASENDDAIGLDASATVALRRGDSALIHVTNSAQGGPIEIDLSEADTTIAGTITDAATGQPIAGASVAAVNKTLYYTYYSTNTDQNGHYLIAVSPGSYYVQVAEYGYVAELYPDAQCQYGSYYINTSVCDTANATVLSPTSGQAIAGIDIALGRGRQIAGLVRNDASQAVSNATVTLFSTSGQQLAYTYTDSVGRYAFTTVPSSAYKLSAQAGGYGSQLYDHVACGGPLQTDCDPSKATPLNVTNQDALGVNFSLLKLALIHGTVAGPSGYGALVCIVDSQGNPATGCANADSTGKYSAGPLPTGTFYAFASANGYYSQIYNGVDCPQDCTLSIASGTAIPISQPGQVGSADFVLNPLPRVYGHVQDAMSGSPLASVTISASILPPAIYTAASATTDSNGDFSLTNTPVGTYYILAASNDHIDQVYPGIPCEQYNPTYYGTPCDVAGAALLTIAPGQTPPSFDFSLDRSSAIGGSSMVRAGAGSDIPAYVEISVYNTSGVEVASAWSDALGNYLVNDLVAGTYYAEAAYSYNASYAAQVWNQVDCVYLCAPLSGTPIIVPSNVTVHGIDFELTRRDAVVGRIRDDSGAPLAGMIVDLFESATGNYSGSGMSDALGFYTAPANPGASYFVATEADAGYVDQVYYKISCPLGPAYFGKCSLSGATPVGLSSNAIQAHIVNFTLYSSQTIFSSNFEN